MQQRDRFIDYLAEIPNFFTILLFPIFFLVASPVLLEISENTGNAVGDLSLIFTFFTLGAVAGQLTSVFYNRRFKKISIILFSYLFLFITVILISLISSLYLFYVLFFVGGYILGVLWIQATKFVLENKIKNKDRLTIITLSFYPVGAFLAPFISSTLARAGLGWRFSYYVVAALIMITAILYIVMIRKRQDLTREEEKVSLKQIFTDRGKNIIFILVSILVIFYCLSETVIATWSPTFFRLERGFNVLQGGYVSSIFWIFIIFGRIIAGLLAGKVKARVIMIGLSVIAIISASLMFGLNIGTLIFILIALSGIGYSAIFPLLISTGSTLYDKGRGVLATVLFAASNVGVSAAPFLTRITSGISMALSVWISVFFMTAVLVLLIIINIKNRLFENKIIIQ